VGRFHTFSNGGTEHLIVQPVAICLSVERGAIDHSGGPDHALNEHGRDRGVAVCVRNAGHARHIAKRERHY
jgi:hypothetical protein